MARLVHARDGVWEYRCPCGWKMWSHTKADAQAAKRRGVKCKGCGRRL